MAEKPAPTVPNIASKPKISAMPSGGKSAAPQQGVSANFQQAFKKELVQQGWLSEHIPAVKKINTEIGAKKAQWEKIKSDWNTKYQGPESVKPEPPKTYEKGYTPPISVVKTWSIDRPQASRNPLKQFELPYLPPEKLTETPLYFHYPKDPVLTEIENAPHFLKKWLRAYENAPLTVKEYEEGEKQKEQATEEKYLANAKQKVEARIQHWETHGYTLAKQDKQGRIYQKKNDWAVVKQDSNMALQTKLWKFWLCKIMPESTVRLHIDPYAFEEVQNTRFELGIFKQLLIQILCIALLVSFAKFEVPQNFWRYAQRAQASVLTLYWQGRYEIALKWPRPAALPISYRYKASQQLTDKKSGKVVTQVRMIIGIQDQLSVDRFELIAKELLTRYQKQYAKVEIALFYERHLSQSVPYYVLIWSRDKADDPYIRINTWTPEFYDAFKK